MPTSPRTHRPRSAGPALAGLVLATLAAGCSPTVNLATPTPVKIDVNMRVDVYSREVKSSVTTPNPTVRTDAQAASDRRGRMEQIQKLKNARVVGESREGLLEIRTPPADKTYAEYAKTTVDAENRDRSIMYMSYAQTENVPPELAQQEFAKRWRTIAFPGEWIQVESGEWIQKK